MQNFTLITTGLNVSKLLEQITANTLLWDEITLRQSHPESPHKDTRSIFLRWSEFHTFDAAQNDLKTIQYPAMKILTKAIALIELAYQLVGATELGRVMLTEFYSGGIIDMHKDEGKYIDHFERFHLPIVSENGNYFLSQTGLDEGEFIHMKPGELWNVNNKQPHCLFNRSHEPRIHLVMDMVAKKYRKERSLK